MATLPKIEMPLNNTPYELSKFKGKQKIYRLRENATDVPVHPQFFCTNGTYLRQDFRRGTDIFPSEIRPHDPRPLCTSMG